MCTARATLTLSRIATLDSRFHNFSTFSSGIIFRTPCTENDFIAICNSKNNHFARCNHNLKKKIKFAIGQASAMHLSVRITGFRLCYGSGFMSAAIQI